MQQIIDGNTTNYTLDLNAGLTQVLDDGTDTYLYGMDRIAQAGGGNADYFLGDALGSVRQMADGNAEIALAQSYDPYGNVISSTGSGTTIYGYTGEIGDSYIKLIYLRSRLYSPDTGRFLTKDSWQGDYNRPLSLNRWMYVNGNPINLTDPTGTGPIPPWAEKELKRLRAKTEECYSKQDYQCVWNNYYELALFGPVFGYPHASDHLMRYLFKQGDLTYRPPWLFGLNFGASSEWVFSHPSVRKSLRGETREMWRLIHLDAISGKTSGHVITGDSPANIPEGPTDIWYAFGDFYVSVEADYEISGCYDVLVKPTYQFHDNYNWEKGLPAVSTSPFLCQ